MNGDAKSRESLKSFYGYKETFRQETTWLPVPQDLTFVHTNNPFLDEAGTAGDDSLSHQDPSYGQYKQESDLVTQLEQAAFQPYATHGLEALSAVASQDQYNYAPPPAHMSAQDISPVQPDSSTSLDLSQPTLAQTLGYVLNQQSTAQTRQTAVDEAPATVTSNIDPRLNASEPVQQAQAAVQTHSHVRINS
jgi:hypothetical protein